MAYYAGMVDMANRPYRPRRDPELENARRREREQNRLESWGARNKYYERCEQQNTKFEEFTSPRYYEEQNKLHEERTTRIQKKELLEKRRETLRKLFMEEDQMFELEAYVVKCSPRSWEDTPRDHQRDSIPVELLKKVNSGIKEEVESKRRHKAETALYEQWRRDSPRLGEAQRNYSMDKMKMSWLDQQIEKRMQKEREEEEAKQDIKEAKISIMEQKKEEELFRKEAELKREELKRGLDEQMRRIMQREEEAKALKEKEDAITRKGVELQVFEDRLLETEKLRKAKEVAIANQRFHKRKIELKAKTVAEELEEERKLIESLQKTDICEKIDNERKRAEINRSMNEFLELLKNLKELEAKRLRQGIQVFDSEAAAVFQQFDTVWKKEENMRKGLVQDILGTLKQQIEDNLERSRQEQKDVLKEREEMLERMIAQKEELEKVKEWEEQKKREYRKCLELQVANKKQREKELRESEKDRTAAAEMDRLWNEEARLKEEIMRMQRGQAVQTYGRRRFFY